MNKNKLVTDEKPVGIGFFEKWLSVWIALSISMGVLLGKLVPTTFEFLASVENKIREEIKSGLKKDKILNPEDALLINEFIKKIQKEISEAEK